MTSEPSHSLRPNRRILVVDDNPLIHQDFRKVLVRAATGPHELVAIEHQLFGDPPAGTPPPAFELDSAFQGEVALDLLARACASGTPYALAFVDVRMPPGWDGIETIERLWKVDPGLQVVICSAYSDYSWNEIRDRLGAGDGLLILQKPFANAEVSQMAHALTGKWSRHEAEHLRAEELESVVRARTSELEELRHALWRSTVETTEPC